MRNRWAGRGDLRKVRDRLPRAAARRVRGAAGRREEAFGEIARHKALVLVAGCRGYLLLASLAAASAETARADLIAGLARDASEFLDRELSTIEGLVGAPVSAGTRAEEIRVALEELSSLESGIS